MSNPADTYRADENRYLYQMYATAAKEPEAEHIRLLTRENNRGWNYYRNEVVEPNSHVRVFTPDKAADAAVAAKYKGRTIEGIGVRQGAYVMSSTDGRTPPHPALLATAFLRDYVGLALVGQDPRNPAHKVSILSHLDVVTDVASAVPQLLQKMPKGYTVTATVLGGDSPNFYALTNTLRALKASPKVKDIVTSTDLGTSMLLDVASGHVFTHKAAEPAYAIGEEDFPIRTHITFYNHETEGLNTIRAAEWQVLLQRKSPTQPTARTEGLFPLEIVDGQPRARQMTMNTEVAQLSADGTLSAEELRAFNAHLVRDMKMPVDVKYDPSREMLEINVNGSMATWVAIPKGTQVRN